MNWIWAFNKVENGLLFVRHTNIFLAHIVVTKDVTFFIFSYLKGCWADLWQAQWWCLKRATCRSYTSFLFFNERLVIGVCKLSSAINEAPLSLMAFYCIFHLKVPQALCFWWLGSSPSHRVPSSTAEGLQAIVWSPRIRFVHQSFVRYCLPLTSSYKLTKACWCWGIFRDFPKEAAGLLGVTTS